MYSLHLFKKWSLSVTCWWILCWHFLRTMHTHPCVCLHVIAPGVYCVALFSLFSTLSIFSTCFENLQICCKSLEQRGSLGFSWWKKGSLGVKLMNDEKRGSLGVEFASKTVVYWQAHDTYQYMGVPLPGILLHQATNSNSVYTSLDHIIYCCDDRIAHGILEGF